MNSIISIRPQVFTYQFILCCQPLFLILLKFSKEQLFKNSLIKLTPKHITQCFWLSSDKTTSNHCLNTLDMSQGKSTIKTLLKSCLIKQETALMAENYDYMFLFSILCYSLDDNIQNTTFQHLNSNYKAVGNKIAEAEA